MTSVKDFSVKNEPTDDSLGEGSFLFTDRYSVFDWGEMPDHIPDKGASLCTMGAFNFELLENRGISTHYLGVGPEGESLEQCDDPPQWMKIHLTQVPDLPYRDGNYDYDRYHNRAGDNYLIPLEIVFRNRVPVGSSLRRRTEPAEHGLEYGDWPDDAVELSEPIIEFSTKYEEQDRYLNHADAEEIAGKAELSQLRQVAREVNKVITERADKAQITHEDGKIECIFYDGEILVADVAGTFDENRFSIGGRQISKEVVRQYYKKHQPEWVQACTDAKDEARKKNVRDWRELCSIEPESLPNDIIRVVRDMYAAGTNSYTGEQWFTAPEILEVLDSVRTLEL